MLYEIYLRGIKMWFIYEIFEVSPWDWAHSPFSLKDLYIFGLFWIKHLNNGFRHAWVGDTSSKLFFFFSEIYLKSVVVWLIKCPSLQVSVWPHCHLIYQMFWECKICIKIIALRKRLTFCIPGLKLFEQSGTQNQLSGKFRRSNQDRVKLKS